jgi:hypothetical protein
MFPKYQQATLDEENRAKKRVIKSLAKAFLNETVSLDVNSSDTAVQIYDKLETKLNLFNALNSEAQTYFASQLDEDGSVVSVTLKIALAPFLGRLLVVGKEISVLSKQLARVFSYLQNAQVNNLSSILKTLVDEMIYLEEGIMIALGMSDDPDYEAIITPANGKPIKNIIKQIVGVCDEFSGLMFNMIDRYTPAVISAQIAGGLRRRDL